MKFKGFWKGLWDLTEHSLAWLKDYWLAYIILFIVVYMISFAIFCVPAVIDELDRRKKLREAEDELEEFLNN